MNRGVFCHVTHDEMAFSGVVSSVWRPSLFSAIGNRYSSKTKTFHRVCVTKFNEFLEPFWQPWPGVSPTAILNEEKTLGTRFSFASFVPVFGLTRLHLNNGSNTNIEKEIDVGEGGGGDFRSFGSFRNSGLPLITNVASW